MKIMITLRPVTFPVPEIRPSGRFFFFFFLGPVCISSGSTSAFKA
jgi:hypothetical protein